MIDSCYPLLLPVFCHDSVYTMMQIAVGNKFFFISLARGFGMSRKVTGSQARPFQTFSDDRSASNQRRRTPVDTERTAPNHYGQPAQQESTQLRVQVKKIRGLPFFWGEVHPLKTRSLLGRTPKCPRVLLCGLGIP